MPKRVTGRHERTVMGGEEVACFVPYPLPPNDPPLAIGTSMTRRLHVAEQALARLDLAGEMVPSLDWFIYTFVRKEAVLSSQIEGTQATLVDLLTFETDTSAGLDSQVEQICNYLNAMSFAREQLADPKGLPLSMRLLNQTHARLMHAVRGGDKSPGEIRRSQNWIGGSRPGNAVYVPPPAHALGDLLGAFEKYIHAKDKLPPLIRAGLLHVQFETIHPYLDGNGRIGRLFVALLLEHWKLLSKPLLYLSLFFKRHRAEYYRRLDAVRTEGDWEGWLDFFLDGIATIADESVASARELFALVEADRTRVLQHRSISLPALRLFELLPRHPLTTIAYVMRSLDTTKPTAGRAVDLLVKLGVLKEMTGKKRDRWFAYQHYLDRLRAGTDLDAPEDAGEASEGARKASEPARGAPAGAGKVVTGAGKAPARSARKVRR